MRVEQRKNRDHSSSLIVLQIRELIERIAFM